MPYAIHEFASLPSTNAYVKEHAVDLSHGDVIVAGRQTEGKGRLDRRWLSTEGGLYFTLFLKPSHTAFLPNMSQLLCLAVCRAIEGVGVEAELKWPNDVLVRGAKIAGILGEAVLEGDRLSGLVLGAGVNLNQREVKIAGVKTTTLAREGVVASEIPFLKIILRHFFTAYDRVVERGFSIIQREYVQKLVLLGNEICVDTGSERLSGTFLRVNHAGRLVLCLEDASVREISVGDMR
ncbi:MAG: biotin--[acetyl-CoA-carboxylase] ligase [Deltaproteobacteria bacterium]|nr:biotin--[acetyl-CoA-carboxylase] ligase [Deltaproteobacteria bacterium]